MTGPIDVAEINRAALAAFRAVPARILPGCKQVGAEVVALIAVGELSDGGQGG
jgi:hypothetical protein